MKRRDVVQSHAAARGGTCIRIHESAARGHADPIPAGKLVFLGRTGLAALTVALLVSVGQAAAVPPVAPIQIQLLNRRPYVGAPVRLHALNLLAEHTHVLWYLEAQPPGSTAKFHNQTSSEASFVPDVPGVFRVRLTDGGDWTRTATLDVTATATPLPPLLPVNTLDVDAQGNPGMTVGNTFYPDPGNGTGFHVVQVDRNTLQGLHNNTVPLDANSISQYTGFFSQTSNSTLIFVALRASAGPIPNSLIDAVNTWLATIGGFLPPRWSFSPGPSQCWSSNTPYCEGTSWNGPSYGTLGSFSVIGVPGMAAGSAWYDDAAQRGTTNGPLVGYLTQGTGVGTIENAGAYAFVFSPDQYVLVDSCASGGPNACVIQIGSQTFAPPAGADGVHVVVLDRVTLRPLTDQTVTSTQALFSALAYKPPVQEGHAMFLGYAGAGDGLFTDRVVVVIQSVGNGTLTSDAAGGLLQVIDQLGGTPETFGKAITGAHPSPYALIGVMSKLPWHGRGIESSPAMVLGQAPNLQTPFPGHARGILARDRLARYTPTANDPVGNANLDLLPIVYQNPTPWPYAGSCSITYIAVQLHLATLNADGTVTGYPDIRSDYYDNPADSWNDQDVLNVPYPGTVSQGPDFPSYCPQSSFLSPQDYSSLQHQLANEFTWVNKVFDLVKTNLKSPFIETEASSTTIVATVAAQVAQSIPTPPSANTSFSWMDVFNLAAAVAGAAVPEASAALYIATAAGQMTFDAMTSSSSGDPATKVKAEANQLATQLNNQTLAHLNGLDRLFEILVADAGKLESVGLNIQNNSAWAWGSNTQWGVNVVNATTTQTALSALLPPTWPVYNLKPDLVHQFSSDDVSTFGCGWENQEGDGGVTHTFSNALVPNQFQALIQLVPGQQSSHDETSTTEVWTFGTLDPYFNVDGAKATWPGISVTDLLFSPTTNGYAAAYPPAWYRSTYNPPSHVTCSNVKGNSSHQAPPPVIGPPAAAYGQ